MVKIEETYFGRMLLLMPPSLWGRVFSTEHHLILMYEHSEWYYLWFKFLTLMGETWDRVSPAPSDSRHICTIVGLKLCLAALSCTALPLEC